MLKLLLVYLSLITVAHSHSWYPPSCCSGQDCKPVPCDELLEDNKGSIKYGNLIFSRSQVNPSQDMNCHVCVGEYTEANGKQNFTPRCVFILPSS